mmetsp:Transcript_9857/g.9587  ORF Transcript_9857/g.9587 Transcript_9857/m.9587 type:complete len:173 (-) Transcript_9857:105-623(-)
MSGIGSDFLLEATKLFQPQEKKKEWYEEIEEEVCSICPKMNYQQRIGGCMIFMTLGFILSMGSVTRIFQLIAGNPVPFATMYTMGNIISIMSTCFLHGPWTQAKKMFAPTRYISTAIYFTLMGVTMFLAFTPVPLRAWYSISFIPFARDFVKAFLANTCCGCLKNQSDDSWG